MGGKKGRSGRKRKWKDNPLADRIRKQALDYYYKHKEARKKVMHDYHKKNVEIMKFAKKEGIGVPEARERLKKQKESEKS